MNKQEVENHLTRIEYGALEPYVQAISARGIEVCFKRCAKRDGGNTKKGSAWGKLVYSDIMTGQNISREDAINLILTPRTIKQAKYDLLNELICAICGKKGIDNNHQWGRLNHLEHRMDICSNCKRDIYEASPKPWKGN